jgi:hypothetical protein
MLMVSLVLGGMVGAVLAGTKAGRAFTVVAAYGLVLVCAAAVVLVALGWALGFWEVTHATW